MMQRALELEPGSLGIRLRVTQLLIALGRSDEARASGPCPRVAGAGAMPMTYNLLGVALASQGRLGEARMPVWRGAPRRPVARTGASEFRQEGTPIDHRS